jgi:hypothetical protein
MNLPANLNQFQVVSRKSEQERNTKLSWGAKSEGIKLGDCVDGIILGFELNEFKTKNIVLKSFSHNGQKLMVWGCSTLTRELHTDDTATELLYNVGDVVRITYLGSYIGKKGVAKDKNIAIFRIDEIVNYELNQNDIKDITEFQDAQRHTKPLAAYPSKPASPVFAPRPVNKLNSFTQKKSNDDDSFDM